MSLTYFSQVFFEVTALWAPGADLKSRLSSVSEVLANHPRAASNTAFVQVLTGAAYDRPVTYDEVSHALIGFMGDQMGHNLDVVGALNQVYAISDTDHTFLRGDLDLFHRLALARGEDEVLPDLLQSLASMSDWFPLCQLLLLASTHLDEATQLLDQETEDDLEFVVRCWAPCVANRLLSITTPLSAPVILATTVAPVSDKMRKAVYAAYSPSDTVVLPFAGVHPNHLEVCARIVVQLLGENFEFETAVVAAGMSLAEIFGMDEDDYEERVASGRRPDEKREQVGVARAWESYMSVYGTLKVVVESIEGVIFQFRRFVDEHLTWLVAPVIYTLDLAQKIGTAVHTAACQAIGALIVALDSQALISDDARATAGAMMYALADLIDIKHRQNPKSVWAILMSRKGARLSRSELFLTQLTTFSHKPSPTYEAWAGDMIARLGRSDVDVSQLSIKPPSRMVFVPRHTFGPARNNDLALAHDTTFHETAREVRRVQQTLARAAPLGIDGAYLMDAAGCQSSIERYVVPRPTIGVEAKQLIRDAADAIFENCRPLYDRPQPMSVGAAMLATEWKYSAGLPFLPAIRTRQQIKSSGWYQAIAKTVEGLIHDGIVPDAAFHAFPKADVVPLQKLLDDISAGRSVTAEDRISCIEALTILGEVNKRVAPLEAWVANQLPRREGALQELEAAIHKRPCIITTDGWRFDSQVPKEIGSIGSTRLVERGVEGWWGAKAVTSFTEAYYSAVQTGLVVNLMDGTVVRKNGGGGTGSAFTSSDNRNWVRIILVGSWSYTFDQPPSAFFNHCTLAHASDDVKMSVDDWCRPRLKEWQDNILALYGLRFEFDTESEGNGWLHLIWVPKYMLEPRDYAEVQETVPTYPMLHDPARLALKRSDYRSDRMRGSYLQAADFIATQDFGHMLLVGHDRMTYHDIATEAMEAVSEYLGFFFSRVEFTVDRSTHGSIVGFDYAVSGEPSNYLKRAAAMKGMHPGHQDFINYCSYRMREARVWMRMHRYPTYLEVLKAWVAPEDWSRLRPAQKKWSKLTANIHVNVPAIDVIQGGLLSLAAVTQEIPTGLTRWSGMDVVPVTRPVVTNAFMVESFVYAKMVEARGSEPSYAEFAAALREGPYGSVTDVNGFWALRSDDRWLEERADLSDMNLLQSRMWVFTVFYALIDWFQGVSRMNRLWGFMMAVFFLLVRDLDKWYSIIHLGYWLEHGRASIAMSNMSPRDPFIAQKMIALLLTALVPLSLLRALHWIRPFSGFMSWLAEVAYHGVKNKIKVANTLNRAFQNPGDRWDDFRIQVQLPSPDGGPITKLHAGMGSGKSTSLPAVLLSNTPWNKVVIIVPQRSMVDNYVNDFVPAQSILRVGDTGDLPGIADKSIIVITAHRALALSLDVLCVPTTMFLFDEAHMGTCAQATVLLRRSHMRYVLMTGTPGGRLWDAVPGRTYSLPAPVMPAREIIEFEGYSPVDPTNEASHQSWLTDAIQQFQSHQAFECSSISRFAVYHPSRRFVEWAERFFRFSSYEVSVTTADSPGLADRGVVVGTWSIVTGVNFVPPIRGMIDCGFEVFADVAWTDEDATLGGARLHFVDCNTVIRRSWSSPSSRDQVAARTARTERGTVLRHPLSGSGPERQAPAELLILLTNFTAVAAWDPSVTLLSLFGLDWEIMVHDGACAPSGLLSWIAMPFSPLAHRLHAQLVGVTMILASAIGSLRDAIAIVKNPTRASKEHFDMLMMIKQTAPDHARTVLLGPLAPPAAELRVMCLRSGVWLSAYGVPQFYAGRLITIYPNIVSISGRYARSHPRFASVKF